MSTTTKNTLATKTVSQGESRYGTPEPQIALRFPKGTSYRVVKAALHKLAAEIELATPASERWCVNTEDFNERARVPRTRRRDARRGRARDGDAQCPGAVSGESGVEARQQGDGLVC
jgi:hypothetical protein